MKETPKEKKENVVEIKVELVGYEELLEKLNNIKKLLQELANIVDVLL